MIFDNRLLTTLPFYDDRDKQAFRQDKCFRNLYTFQQLTDLKHLPPFEIMTECSGTSCDDASWELYDTEDSLAQDLDASGYDICDMIDTYTGNDKDGDFKKWFIYDGDGFCNSLPVGLHYIKATIGSCTYYSEVFNICLPVSSSYTSSDEVFTSWPNDNFDTFASSGRDITDADITGDLARAYTDPFNGCSGDVFDYSFETSWVDKTDATITMYIAKTTDVTTAVSNILTITSETTYTGQFTTTASGPYVLVLKADASGGDLDSFAAVCSLTHRVYSADADNNIILEYGHSCDIENTVYQYGFKNKLIFSEKVDLVKPTYETVKTAEARDGFLFVDKVVSKKIYKMVFYAPEYMADAINLLQNHDNITLTDRKGDSITVDEVNTDIAPATNCYHKITIEMVSNPINSSNCCDSLDLS